MKNGWGAAFVLSFIAAGIYLYVVNYGYHTKKEALQKGWTKEAIELNTEKVQSVTVPNSPYVLEITNAPHKIYVFKITKHFGKYKASLADVYLLYQSINKDGMYFNKNLLEFGFDTDKPRNKDIYIDHQKMRYLSLGKYFSKSKFAWSYQNLSFYYPEHPMETKAIGPAYH
ncbi:hypothetical protein [Fictibacillus sp. FJAT-27399]|uniref:hypothetical protein n=1 Tax=Fictibacillus sp. FJAT-27399 TaxID=1729689 RepID=UPI000781C24B|nr:hypothetical protein [Fictibacillus sp. FJAT-27399]